MNKLVVILGPTASGKTELAVKLAKKFKGEIVSADSRQIYRGMDVGTAKPTKKEQTLAKHHLIDIKTPKQSYTVWQYKQEATKKIKEILKKGKIPFLVGGTGLYIKAVVDNLNIPKVKPDKNLRKKLELRIKKRGLKSIYEELVKIDPEAAYVVDPQNPRRVIRAFEITLKTKKPFSKHRKKGRPLYETLQIGLNPRKEKLGKIIERRANAMIKTGLIKEVAGLMKRYQESLPAFDAIGYREIVDYLDNKISLLQAVEKIKRNTKRFAKRQMTWFKKDKRIHWVKNQRQSEKLIKEFL